MDYGLSCLYNEGRLGEGMTAPANQPCNIEEAYDANERYSR